MDGHLLQLRARIEEKGEEGRKIQALFECAREMMKFNRDMVQERLNI